MEGSDSGEGSHAEHDSHVSRLWRRLEHTLHGSAFDQGGHYGNTAMSCHEMLLALAINTDSKFTLLLLMRDVAL
jgi:hypothetical protein